MPKPAQPYYKLPNERWKIIRGYFERGAYGTTRYLVSTHGRVKSLCNGEYRMLRLGTNDKGYRCVSLCKDGKDRTVYVHHLVLEAFVGPRPDGYECLHANRIRDWNHFSNLSWGTSSANSADMLRHGTTPLGERNGQAKLTEDDIHHIWDLREQEWTHQQIADVVGCGKSTVGLILSGYSWSHIYEQRTGQKPKETQRESHRRRGRTKTPLTVPDPYRS